jgi:hypothetical protein
VRIRASGFISRCVCRGVGGCTRERESTRVRASDRVKRESVRNRESDSEIVFVYLHWLVCL